MKKILLLSLVVCLFLISTSIAAAAPTVTIVNPTDNEEFDSTPIDVDGTLSSLQTINYVEAVVYDQYWNLVDSTTLNYNQTAFWGEVDLAAGDNYVYVSAQDIFFQWGWDSVTVCYDDPFTPDDECLA